MINWEHVRDAVEAVLDGPAKRIDGEGFKAYRVPGGIVRVDVLPEQKGADDGTGQGHATVQA